MNAPIGDDWWLYETQTRRFACPVDGCGEQADAVRPEKCPKHPWLDMEPVTT